MEKTPGNKPGCNIIINLKNKQAMVNKEKISVLLRAKHSWER